MIADQHGDGLSAWFESKVEGWQLRRIIESINGGYNSTQHTYDDLSLCRSFDLQSRGHLRGSLISQRLLGLHSPDEGIEASKESNSLGTFSFAKIVLNQTIVLTHKSNDYPSTLPEESDYRKRDARKYNPGSDGPLLDLLSPKKEDLDYLYGVITHKPNELGVEPGFISVVFPCKEYREVLDYVDLIQCCERMEEGSRLKRRLAPIEHEKKRVRLK